MLEKSTINQFVEQTMALLPKDMMAFKEEFESNLKTAMTSSLKHMDLVTREEFDVQAALLARSRELLDELQEKVEQLEQQTK